MFTDLRLKRKNRWIILENHIQLRPHYQKSVDSSKRQY